MANVGNLVIKITADNIDLINKINISEAKVKTAAQSLGSLGKKLTLGLSNPIAKAAVASIKLGAGLVETISRVEVVFGSAAVQVKAFGETSLESVGLAEQTVLDMTAKYGDMATSIGFTTNAAAEMGTELTKRAADMASFYNMRIDIAETALASVYTGETESLEKFGISMIEANLAAFALAEGYEKTIKEMNQMELASLRMNYVMDATAAAQGDFERTSKSAAAQMRIAKEGIKEMGAAFSKDLQPIVASSLVKINKLIQKLTDISPAGKKVILFTVALAAAAGPLLVIWSKLITAGQTITKAIVPLVAKLGIKIGRITAETAATSTNVAVKKMAQKIQAKESLATKKQTLAGLVKLGMISKDTAATMLNAAATAGLGGASGAATPTVWGLAAAVIGATWPVLLIVAAIGLAVAAVLIFTKKSRKLNKETKKLTKSVEENKKAYNTQQKEIEASGEATKDMATELYELEKKANKTDDEMKRMGTLILGLNRAMPTLNLTLNKQTGLLSKQEREVNKLIKARLRTKKAQRAEERLIEIDKEKLDLQEQIVEISEEYADKTEKIERKTKDLIEKLAELNEEEQEHAVVIAENTQLLEEQQRGANQQIDIVALQKQAREEEQVSIADHYAKIEELKNSSDADAETKIVEHLDQIEEIRSSYHEEVLALEEDHLASMGTIYDDGIDQQELSIEQATANLEKQVEQFNTWQSDIQAVSSRVPKSVADELRKLGPEAGPLIAELASATDTELDAFVEAYESKTAAANEAAVNELKDTEAIESAAFEMGEIVPEKYSQGLASMDTQIESDMIETGEFYISGLVQGLEDNAYKAYNKAGKIAARIVSTIQAAWDMHSPSRKGMKLTSNLLAGMTIGLENNEEILSKSAQVANSVAEQIQSTFNNYTSTSVNNTYHNTYQAATTDNDDVNMIDFINRIRRGYA